MKIVFLDAATLGDTSLAPIAELGELVCYPTSTREESLERVGDCEVLIVNKLNVDAELMDRAPKLRLICEAATGVNNIDLKAAQERGIPVRNAAGYSTNAVVQNTFAHLLSLVGHASYFDDYVKSGRYSSSNMFCDISRPFMQLCGRTMGIIGMGNIGQKVAAIATAFGMNVVYYSTSGTSHCKDYPSLELSQLLKQSDVVSIHAPLNEKTNNLIRGKELAMMKKTACILNLGRGGIVNEADLAAAIDAGVIAGAAVDVFVTEPLPASSPLLAVKHKERLSLSPHIAWASREALDRLVAIVAENIRQGF